MANVKTIAFIIVALLVGAAIGATVVTLTSGSNTSSATKTYEIGAVLPLTGAFAAYGKSMTNAVELAASQMNTNLTASGIPVQFKVVTEDDSGTAAGALTAFQTLYQTDHVQVIVGPLTTPEVQGIIQYAGQNYITSLPPAVGSVGTSFSNDTVFETGEPTSAALFVEMAQSVIQLGITHVAFLYRGDTAETAVYNQTGALLKAAGVSVQGVEFAPSQSDYSSEVSAVSSDVQSFLSAGASPSNTAIFLAGLGTEASNILTHAAVDKALGEVRWFGVAADADQSLLNNTVTGSFMAHVNFTIPLTYTSSSPQGTNFQNDYSAAYGSSPEPYANYAYDNAWIGMFSILAAGSSNGKLISGIVPTIADHYFQVTGTGTYLSPVHDQIIAFYNVGQCEQVGTNYQFVSIGLYNFATNVLTLSSK